jgi:DNA-3-methyladenine glycosylase I
VTKTVFFESLLSGIIRSWLKIRATIANALAFLDVQEEFGTFPTFIRRFVEDHSIRNAWQSIA